jgi:hypothetical protein
MNPLSDNDLELINNLLNKIDETIVSQQGKIGFTAKTLVEARKLAMTHHSKFLLKFKIKQDRIDPYKILSWYCFYLVEVLDDPDKRSIAICLGEMNNILKHEKHGLYLPSKMLRHLYELAINNNTDDEYAIGKNGVYAVFTSCSEITKPLNSIGFAVPKV